MSFLRNNTLAIVALVLATTGTTIAASRYVISNVHQISPQALRELQARELRVVRGPEGKEGKEGVQKVTILGGATGPQGPRGEGIQVVQTIPVQGYPGHSAYFSGETAGGFSVCIEGEGCRFLHNGATGATGPTGP